MGLLDKPFQFWYNFVIIMKSKNLLEQLRGLSHFDKDTIRQLGMQLEIKPGTIDTYISRFLKYKKILPLKKGLYVSADFFSKNRDDISYPFYLANIIRTPSYVSSWAALQYYNLITEAIHGITSVTPKVTRVYKTKVGTFSYQSIRMDLFSNFSLEKGKFDFLVASPAKALFDLLYFRTHQFRDIRLEEVRSFVEELRIDIDEMPKKERSRFYELTRKYINHE